MSEYKRRWYASVRYAYHLDEAELPLTETWAGLEPGVEPNDDIIDFCSPEHDVKRCPAGTKYVAGSEPPCLVRESTPPAQKPPVCVQGSFWHNGACQACPRGLTTMYAGATSESECLYCNRGQYMVNSHSDHEACHDCGAGDFACKTTDTFGSATAHRQTSCPTQCSPAHMHESVSAMYNCDFETCALDVRAQDIHPCVFDGSGNVRDVGDDAAPRCHPYFRPFTDASMAQILSLDTSQRFKTLNDASEEIWNVVRLYDSANTASVQKKRDYLQENMAQVQQERDRNGTNFYYFYHLTANSQPRSRDGLPWPRVQNVNAILESFETQTSITTETYAIKNILQHVPLLSVKHATTLRNCREALTPCTGEDASAPAHSVAHVDYARILHAAYVQQYAQPRAQQCSSTCGLYYCSSKHAVSLRGSTRYLSFLPPDLQCMRAPTTPALLNLPPGALECVQTPDPELFSDLLKNATIAGLHACGCTDTAAGCDVACLVPSIRVEYEVDADSGSFCFDFSSSATFGRVLDELQGSAYPLQGICARVAQARDVWFCNRENLREIGKIQFEIQGSSNNQGRLGVQMGTLVGEDTCMPVPDPQILPLQQQCSVDQDGIQGLIEQTVPEYHAGSLMQKLNDMLLVHEDYNVSSLGAYTCTLTADGSALPCKVESVQNSAAQISYPSAYQAAAPTAAELSLCIESHGSKRCKSQAVTLTHAEPRLCRVNTPSRFAFARKVILHKGIAGNKVR